MKDAHRRAASWVALAIIVSFAVPSFAQASNSGLIQGIVKDPSGAVVPGAKVEISNPVSGFHREATTGPVGEFRFANLPFNEYHLVISAQGFAPYVQDVEVRSSLPVALPVALTITNTGTSITVEATGEDLLENDPHFHTDLDRGFFDKLPLESQSSSVSSLVTLASPGVTADSNGMFHALGDHAESSFSVDGQPITDQQSKVFSNQIPADSIQSLEVISGAPPAEYGDKTSLVIKVTTRSGLGQKKPTGNVSASYGSFGTSNAAFDLGFGNAKWGNFIAVNGFNTGRFLDPPEFEVNHAKGNQQNVFDRLDFQLSNTDNLHFNVGYTRSWFQTPNSFDSAAIGQDQRAQINTFNIAPTWTHLFSPSTLLTLAGFARRDHFQYFPSADPFSDLTETLAQDRKLTNAGAKADLSYVKGKHNLKGGVLFQHWLLDENFNLGVTDPAVNSPCVGANGAPVGDPSFIDPSQCAGAGFLTNAAFVPLLACFDLTRPLPSPASGCATAQSGLFGFNGHGDIKGIALYIQDTLKAGNWSFDLGIRGDMYRGFSKDSQIQPRAGVAYNIKRSNTVLRASYARVLETPFNENLVLASQTEDPFIEAIFGPASGPIPPGQRNEFHAGFQQAFGKFLVVDGDYLWKYTHNAYDFGVLLNTPIFFPIAWHNSKINGFGIRVSLPNYHGLTAFTVLSSASARFFRPQVGGLGSDTSLGVFRIDHDQKFQQTTHLQYQPWKKGPWWAFNWRYDSGVVAGAVPLAEDPTTPVDLTLLTADQQMQAGLFCGTQFPTLTSPLTTCDPALYGSTRINLPAPGTQDSDLNPPRIKPRHLLDASIGDDNLFNTEHHKWSLRFTAVNLTNKVTLYNFLSTFSGTHFVTPRSYTAELGFHF